MPTLRARRPRRLHPARGVFAWAVLLCTLTALAGWVGTTTAARMALEAETLTPEELDAVTNAREAFAQSLDEAEARFEAVDSLSWRETGRLRRSLNAAHVRTARRLGVEPVATQEEVASAEGLMPLDASSPYYATRWGRGPLTSDALAALDSIGVRFQSRLAEAGLPAYQFVVSSTFRTAEHQDRLRGVNANAARGRSSHEFGTTFDIAYRRYRFAEAGFVERPALPDSLRPWVREELQAELDRAEEAWAEAMASRYDERLQAVLGRALIELEDEGVLIALREVRQPCFHVTVARDLS